MAPQLTCWEDYDSSGENVILTDKIPALASLQEGGFDNRIASCCVTGGEVNVGKNMFVLLFCMLNIMCISFSDLDILINITLGGSCMTRKIIE